MASQSPTDADQQAQTATESRPPDAKLDTHDLTDALRHMSVATAASDTHSPISSAPPTPGLKTPLSRRTSQHAASPITKESPRTANTPTFPRRPSSSASVSRPPSSPRLMKKTSRTSLGGPDDQERRPNPKRSISNLISGLREAQATMESIEEPIPLTAPQIAADHFSRELLGHERPDADAETVVILHDACYGHRFSRLKTNKTSLSMIVERPERIHASVLGASTAYVRLGGHHAAGKRPPHPDNRTLSNPPFKIRRSGRSMDITSSYVTNVHGTAWMSELQGLCHTAGEKLAAGAKELSRTSAPGEPEKESLHEGDLYLAPESLNAFQGALGGVADAIDTVFDPATSTSKAFVAVRPPGHHCSADHPSGFCWLNNVHVGIEYAAQAHGLTHAAILDFDLHHGDGSQAITWERNSKNNEKRLNAKPNSKLKLSPDIGYYSIHDINSYPCEMGDDEKVQAASLCIENAHGQSIWNVHLQPWKTEDDFWKLYEERYSVLLDKAKIFLKHHAQRLRAEGKVRPKTAIFISAGFDASEWEGSGMQRHKVNVPTEFYARITRDVAKLAQETEGCDGRVISVLEGGYSDRALCSGVLSHLSGLCASPVTPKTNGVEALMDLSSQMNRLSFGSSLTYDKTWWSEDNLTALENKVNPPPPPQAKKIRGGPQPTYATPTESFAYKVLDPQKFARSISGTMREAPVVQRPPTPPAPEVDWVVATQELSKLLIPIGRQTKSCTVEELAVPRTKKERQTVTPPAEIGQPRQLRDRRAKGPVYSESVHSDETASVRSVSRSESRASRRETIDVLPIPDPVPTQQRRVSRRQSAGSALGSSNPPFDHDAPPVPPMPSRPAMTSRTSSDTGAMKPPPIPTPNPQAVNKKVRAPSQNRKPVTTNSGVLASAPKSSSTLPSKPIGEAKTSDVDRLASGMKKITLKVSSSKEEHDRRQKEKLDAERRARALKGAETRRVNAAAKKAAAAKEAGVPQKQPLLPAPIESIKAEPQAPALPLVQKVEDVAMMGNGTNHISGEQKTETPSDASGWGIPALPTENIAHNDAHGPPGSLSSQPLPALGHEPSPIDVPTSLVTPAEDLEFPEYANSSGSASVSPALKPEDGPTYAAHQPASLPGPELKAGTNSNARSNSSSYSPSWMRPTANTSSNGSPVSPKRTPSSPVRPSSSRQLPVFSSTGPIPFGATPTSPERKAPRSPPKSLWKHNPVDGEGGIVGNGVGTSMLADQQEKKSIWDVSDTPAK